MINTFSLSEQIYLCGEAYYDGYTTSEVAIMFNLELSDVIKYINSYLCCD